MNSQFSSIIAQNGVLRKCPVQSLKKRILFDLFLEAFRDFPTLKEASYESFCEMLADEGYGPDISVGAYVEAGELVGFVLNSRKSSPVGYMIVTATSQAYRRQGIATSIFAEKIIATAKWPRIIQDRGA